MATQSISLPADFEALAAPFVASGHYANSTEVLHAAMDSLRLATANEQAINDALLLLAEEGEASGDAEGDIFSTVRAKYGLRSLIQG